MHTPSSSHVAIRAGSTYLHFVFVFRFLFFRIGKHETHWFFCVCKIFCQDYYLRQRNENSGFATRKTAPKWCQCILVGESGRWCGVWWSKNASGKYHRRHVPRTLSTQSNHMPTGANVFDGIGVVWSANGDASVRVGCLHEYVNRMKWRYVRSSLTGRESEALMPSHFHCIQILYYVPRHSKVRPNIHHPFETMWDLNWSAAFSSWTLNRFTFHIEIIHFAAGGHVWPPKFRSQRKSIVANRRGRSSSAAVQKWKWVWGFSVVWSDTSTTQHKRIRLYDCVWVNVLPRRMRNTKCDFIQI